MTELPWTFPSEHCSSISHNFVFCCSLNKLADKLATWCALSVMSLNVNWTLLRSYLLRSKTDGNTSQKHKYWKSMIIWLVLSKPRPICHNCLDIDSEIKCSSDFLKSTVTKAAVSSLCKWSTMVFTLKSQKRREPFYWTLFN